LHLVKISNIKTKNIALFCSTALQNKNNDQEYLLREFRLSTINPTSEHLPPVDHSAFSKLFDLMPFLESVEISFNFPEEPISLLEANANSNITIPIRILNLKNQYLDCQSCHQIINGFDKLSFLQKLDISHNDVGDGTSDLHNHGKNLLDLQVLKACKANLTESSFQGIVSTLSYVNISNSLCHLDLRGNQFAECKAMKDFCLMVHQLKNLTYLDISHNHVGDKNACNLLRGLRSHPCISVLLLGNIQVSSIALQSAMYNLRGCCLLEELSLQGNYFEGDVLKFFNTLGPISANKYEAEVPGGLPMLSKLDLSGVHKEHPVEVESSSVQALVNSLPFHQRISSIVLKNCKFHTKDLVLILNACEVHSTVKELRLSRRTISQLKTSSSVLTDWKCLHLD